MTLAAGSAHWHGSHTEVGAKYDVNMVAVVAFISYRQITTTLNGTSSVSKCLNLETCIDPVDLSSDFAFFSSNLKSDLWQQRMLDLADEYPNDYLMTFAGIVIFSVFLILGDFFGHLALLVICLILPEP